MSSKFTVRPAGKNSSKPLHVDLEVKDPQLIFSSVWNLLEGEVGRRKMIFPRELILLGGAPGSGKGTNTPFVMEARGLTCEPIVVSSLLDSAEAQRIKNSGGMVGDRQVVEILFRKILNPEYRDGVILDGFPRTYVQVECLKLLVAQMNQLRREFYNTPHSPDFRRPVIHIMVLFVDEKVSIARQINRGNEIHDYNEEIRRTGLGELKEERATDQDPEAARRRYSVFKEQTYDALQSLRETFHYHFINAQGTFEEVQENIVKELQYQSSLELDPKTYDRLRVLPIASEIILHARQDLVRRLDSYEFKHADLLQHIVHLIDQKFMPLVLRHALTGRAYVNSEDTLFENPLALAMILDVFSERGYHAVVDIHRQEIPGSVDLKTGEIQCRIKKVFRFQIYFRGSNIRRGG
jgi:adenylate kinase